MYTCYAEAINLVFIWRVPFIDNTLLYRKCWCIKLCTLHGGVRFTNTLWHYAALIGQEEVMYRLEH